MDGSPVKEPVLQSVNILGVPVQVVEKRQLIATAAAWAKQGECKTITYVNAHCLNLACTDAGYRSLLKQADLVYSDGIGPVWAGKFLHRRRLTKATGRDWIHDFCALAEKEGLRLFFLAGAPGIALQAAENLARLYPALRITGCSDGYFQPESESRLLEKIADCGPQVLFVGMGTPLQERWIASHRREISAPVCWGVGALFDYMAGKEAPVPAWMEKLGLEWLWRLCLDPLGKWRRYLLGIPVFVFRVWLQKMHLRFS